MRLECAENEKKDTINVLMGVFFDGCDSRNHDIRYYRKRKGNVDWTKQNIWEKSNETEYTNVAYLYNAYKHTLEEKPNSEYDYIRRIYVSGFDNADVGNIATASSLEVLKRDIVSKVKSGCKKIYNDLSIVIDVASEKFPVAKVNLLLDVYGEGRGAAIARVFVNSFNKPQKNDGEEETSFMSYWIDQLGYVYSDDEKVEVSVEVRFVGLYDTISTYIKKDDGIESDSILDLGLNCGEESTVKRGVHFCAADEYRSKFPLATVDSYKNIDEFIFPGSHSDIAGGYRKVVQERLMINQVLNNIRLEKNHKIGLKEVPGFIKQGWYSLSESSVDNLEIEPCREVVNTYSLVFLFLMYSEAIIGGFDFIIDINALRVSNSILWEDPFMENVLERMYDVARGSSLYNLRVDDEFELGDTGLEFIPIFEDGDEDDKIVKGVRRRYIHLPSTIVLDSKTQKIKNRTILKG